MPSVVSFQVNVPSGTAFVVAVFGYQVSTTGLGKQQASAQQASKQHARNGQKIRTPSWCFRFG